MEHLRDLAVRLAMDEPGSPVPDERGARLHLMRQAAASIVAGEGDAEDLAHEIYCQAAESQSPELRPVADRFLEPYVAWGATYDQTEKAGAATKAAAQSFLRDHPA